MKSKMEMTVAENLTVTVEANKEHEFIMNTNEVAKGYGVSKSTIWMHRERHTDELIEGKHYFTILTKSEAGCKSNNYPPVKRLVWTKRGIVRLGFFIKSERAKMFRDWAEDLILFVHDQAAKGQQLQLWPEPEKRKHNRLTQERLVDILADVAKIDDKDLRLSLIEKLMNNK